MSLAPPANGMAAAVWGLGITQIIGYGTLYYSFGTLAPGMAADFGWSEQWVFGVLSFSLLIGGLVAPLSGSLADRFGAARILSFGSVGAALALALCALAPERISFVLGLVAIEIASAFALYATAFAALAQAAPQGAQRSITHLTLIAGFASTIFWPLTSWLVGHFTWREIYLGFAVLNLVVSLPIHLWLARHQSARRLAGSSPAAPLDARPVDLSRDRAIMALMLTAFALVGFMSSSILVHMVPLLDGLALGAAGTLATILFGPAQVLSRVVNMQFGRGLSQSALAIIAATSMSLGLALLAFASPWPPSAALFAILFGMGSGLTSIVSGTLPLALFGHAGYGRRLGWLSSARLIVSALAPFAFAAIVSWSSPRLAVWSVAAVGIVSVLCFFSIWRLRADRSAPPMSVIKTS